MNMSLDGYCDHTEMNADDEIHKHYTELLRNSAAIVYGRKTFELMEFWPPLVKQPSGNKAMDEFAVVMDDIPKVVFSRTLTAVDWETARLATRDLAEEIADLRAQENGDVLVGSPSLIVALTRLKMIDEYQVAVQPVVIGRGLTLFKDIEERVDLNLIRTKTFTCGAVLLYYQPAYN